MTTCGGDYLNISWISRSYVILYAVMCYFVPLAIIIFSYYYIVKVLAKPTRCRALLCLFVVNPIPFPQAVAAHEKNMREQAKKMNIASLRSQDQASSENKLAMVRKSASHGSFFFSDCVFLFLIDISNASRRWPL